MIVGAQEGTMRRNTGLCRLQSLVTIVATASVTYLLVQLSCSPDGPPAGRLVARKGQSTLYTAQHQEFVYDKSMPLVFIGGMPRSGTTLMRAMLDAHPEVRCGEETRLVPRLLSMRAQWMKSAKEHGRLLEAGLTDEVVDEALASFILEIIVRHGELAPRLCNKDPFVLKSMAYLHHLFPNGRYLLMLRDGRATVHSIISRKVTITGFNIQSYKDCLTKWNMAVENMYNQCMKLGSELCLPVYYEQLVLHPEEWMHKILTFLEIPWDESVLHHEETVGKPGGISLSKKERSTDQVIKPVNLEALSKWVGHIPQDVLDNMEKIAPMLARLGYDPRANPPNYGTPDRRVLENEDKLRAHPERYAANVRQVMDRPDKLPPPPEGAVPGKGGAVQGKGGREEEEEEEEKRRKDHRPMPPLPHQRPPPQQQQQEPESQERKARDYGPGYGPRPPRKDPHNPKFARRGGPPYPQF